MHIPEIIEVKDQLENLKQAGLVSAWELPYENILTRRSAAIFFFTPAREDGVEAINGALNRFNNYACRPNTEQKLSKLKFRITFNPDERQS